MQKIVVLCGGFSLERNVSLKSGELIAKSLIRSGFNVAYIDLSYGVESDNLDDLFVSDISEIPSHSIEFKEEEIITIKEFIKTNTSFIGPKVLDICKLADMTFLALHGSIGENGVLQDIFDLQGIKYTGSSSLGSKQAMDKHISKKLVSDDGLLTPKWNLVTDMKQLHVYRGYPYFLKLLESGSSIGVHLVESHADLEEILPSLANEEGKMMIEEKVFGREFSVGVLNDLVLPPIEIVTSNRFFDYESKYIPNKAKETFPDDLQSDVISKLKEITLRIHRLLNLNVYSRIDFIMDINLNFYFLEANTLPGMTPNSLFPKEALEAGIKFDELCIRLVNLSMEKYI